jgi:hypothetical protein
MKLISVWIKPRSLVVALRVISHARDNQVAFGEKRTSTGRQSRLVWSRMTRCGHERTEASGPEGRTAAWRRTSTISLRLLRLPFVVVVLPPRWVSPARWVLPARR